MLSFKDFKRLSETGNLIPLTATLNADTETPISAFLKMTRGPYRFLLESIEGGERWGRYSFLGSEPGLVFRSRGDRIELLRGKRIDRLQGNPLEVIREILRGYHPVETQGLPRFAGGLVGYLGYDVVRFMERLPDLKKPGLPLEDAQLMLQDTLIAFDNLKHELQIVVMSHLDGKASLKKHYETALRRWHAIAARLRRRLPQEKRAAQRQAPRPSSNTSEGEFHRMVERAKKYIRAGDI
ncbi:MAG TPA: anthranilate synthase component I, partial [Deltaproteobacteria bacterium]|nr:anthranilate synthase component I [Deltaproteobacteria bacterium]